ncbi:hypothetical protein JHW43_001945 [Diplocarpon mali]|nr:hypothetical protein JHW43_001945 [Diplocarpon mali]
MATLPTVEMPALQAAYNSLTRQTDPPTITQEIFPLQIPRPKILSDYARKYGLSPSRESFHNQLFPIDSIFQKSLFSPVPAFEATVPFNERHRGQVIDGIQRLRMRGLSSGKLQTNDIVTGRRLAPSTLNCPIYPLLSRERWVSNSPGLVVYPLMDPSGNGVKLGEWAGNDDIAWNTFETFAVFDAMLLGNEEELDPNRFPSTTLLQNVGSKPAWHKVFHPRKPLPQNAAECKAEKEALEQWPSLQNLYWSFSPKNFTHDGTRLPADISQSGNTTWLPSVNSLAIFICYERLALLLRNDLSDADRLGLQFNIAETMVHEMVHAYGMAKRHRKQVLGGGPVTAPEQLEPYFMDELCAELGGSMETAVFGGIVHELTYKSFGVPLGSILIRPPQPGLTSLPAAELLARSNFQEGGYNIAQGVENIISLLEQTIKKSGEILAAIRNLDSTSEDFTSAVADSQEYARGLRTLLEFLEIELTPLLGNVRDQADTDWPAPLDEFSGAGARLIEDRLEVASLAVTQLWNLQTRNAALPEGIAPADERSLATQDEAAYVRLAEAAAINCDKVISSMGASLLVRCWARILNAYNSTASLESRLAEAERAVETLKLSATPPGREQEQKNVLSSGEVILDRLRIQAQIGGRPQLGEVYMQNI